MRKKSADLVNRVLLTGEKPSLLHSSKIHHSTENGICNPLYVRVCEVKENSFSVSVVQYTEPHTSGQGFFFFHFLFFFLIMDFKKNKRVL